MYVYYPYILSIYTWSERQRETGMEGVKRKRKQEMGRETSQGQRERGIGLIVAQ